MSFSVERSSERSGVQVLTLKGQLDAHSYHTLKDELIGLRGENKYKVVLHCAELEYISSAGLSVLKLQRKEFSKAGGDIKLTKVPDKIANVLRLLGFSKIIQSFDSIDLAVASFQDE